MGELFCHAIFTAGYLRDKEGIWQGKPQQNVPRDWVAHDVQRRETSFWQGLYMAGNGYRNVGFRFRPLSRWMSNNVMDRNKTTCNKIKIIATKQKKDRKRYYQLVLPR